MSIGAMTPETGRVEQRRAPYHEPHLRHADLLEQVFREAMQAWRASCQERVRVRTTSGRTMRGKGGEVVPLPDLVVTETLPAKGDPRYLAQALKALAELRALQGSDEAAKPTRRDSARAEAWEFEAAEAREAEEELVAELRREAAALGLQPPGRHRPGSDGDAGIVAAAPLPPGAAVDEPPLNRAARRRKERAAGRRR